MLIAFDFGISNTDIAVYQDNKSSFHTIPSEHKSISPELIKEVLDIHSLSLSEISLIGVTGGKSSDLPENLDLIPVVKINEVDAIGFGAKVLYDIAEEPTLVISAGTGTACVMVQGNNFNHLGGIAVGGGMLEGLGSCYSKMLKGKK